uniref:Chondroitin sulfate proteoglycan 5 n=1 Tax=Pelusios castaneus TaxID=367368 RepID=A0A8C8SZH5_9SAUR
MGCPGGVDSQRAWPPKALLAKDNEGPVEALSAPRGAWPGHGEAIVLELSDTKRAPDSTARPVPESQEEAGSGDQLARASLGGGWTQGAFVALTLVPPTDRLPTERVGAASTLAGQGLSSDSAEVDLLLQAFGEAALEPPTPRDRGPELGHQSVSEIIDIDYYDFFDGESQGRGGGLEDFPAGGPGGANSPKKKLDDKTKTWAVHELYDDFTPFDESDFYPTTSFYMDGDEDGEDDELDEEEEEEEDRGGGLARDLEDENNEKLPTPATPKIQTMVQVEEPTSHHYVIPPLQTIVSGSRPAESSKDLSQPVAVGPGNENHTECSRSGYVRYNSSCKSVCDIFPSYCLNGGQCYLVENLGALCRCNTQDYIWHKGIRCESIITDFQVMCVAVGSAALVVLLLFMMTVFFAKKLYLLKTENNKLRKTKYRTPSEVHNDNFSLSTIAEGSHPNVRNLCNTPCNLSSQTRDDSSAPLKLQGSVKSCMKEEEPFNIQNSTSPKHDNGTAEPEDSDVNCLQNNLT